MKSKVCSQSPVIGFWIGLCFLCSISLGLCQTATPTTVEMPAPFEESLHKFQSKTVWGQVNVLVRVTLKGFQVEIKSDSPVSGWVLKDEKTSKTLSKGGLNPAHQLKFGVNQPFQSSLRLTLYLNSGREQVPVAISLAPQKEDKAGTTLADGLEEFQDNPDHPYNKMVKNLYEQAVDNYAKGDNLHAVEFLKKAKELDPIQPQVQKLLEKIQGPTDKPSNPLDKVRDDMKKGNMDEALAKLDDYLEEHPDDEEALALKDKIEGRSPKVVKKTAKPKKAAIEKKTPVNESSQDIQAKADQAYNLGLDSYRQGDYAAAKKFWEETLQIQPTYLQAQRNLERLKEDHPELK